MCEFPNKPIPHWNRSRNYNAYNISNRGCFTSNSSKKLPLLCHHCHTLYAQVCVILILQNFGKDKHATWMRKRIREQSTVTVHIRFNASQFAVYFQLNVISTKKMFKNIKISNHFLKKWRMFFVSDRHHSPKNSKAKRKTLNQFGNRFQVTEPEVQGRT